MVYFIDMSEVNVLQIVWYLLLSPVCGGGIVAGISKLIANWLSKRMLDHYNNKHEKELEKLKSEYSTALAKTQHEYDKLVQKHVLYSQSQFELYNSLWKQLIYTKRLADDLWNEVDPKKIPSFASQIGQTKYVIEENMLLIEESHYTELLDLMTEFDNFSVGKRRLIEIRQSSVDDLLDNISDISQMIESNKGAKQRYDSLVSKLGNSFRSQIHG